jgi:uncharacterized protein YbjT (DUF2867 family)
MLDPSSLDAAFAGVDAVVTSAAGYTKRRKTDTDRTDTEGNRNLADAAHRAGIRRFVFLGILQSDLARDVPHFWHKVETEQPLVELGVPYVSLRPGAFFRPADDSPTREGARGRPAEPVVVEGPDHLCADRRRRGCAGRGGRRPGAVR